MGDKVFLYEGNNDSGGHASIFVEPDTGPKDAPFTDPLSHLGAIEFDSEALDYMEVAVQVLGVPITHAQYTAGSPPAGFDPDPVDPNAYTATHDLVTHGLGFVPFAIVVYQGVMVPPGVPIQALGNSLRLLTPVVTTTKVQLLERVLGGSTTLESGTFEYDVIVFNVPATGDHDLDIRVDEVESPTIIHFKSGTFDSTKRYLRVADGEASEFRFWKGKSIDLANAVARVGLTPNATLDDAIYIGYPQLNYDGSFDAGDLVSYEVSVADDDEEGGATFVDISAAGLKVVDHGNVVFDTSRRLAGIFQIVDLSNVVLTFPNPPSDYVYRQRVISVFSFFIVDCITFASILPQEWTDTVELATLVSDQGDFLLGLVAGSRTNDPDQFITSLSGPLQSVSKLMEEGVTIVVPSSILLERSFFIRRAVTFDIQGDKLVAILQQSTKDNVDTVSTIDPYGLGPYNDASASDTECVTRVIDARQTGGLTAENVALYLEGGVNACTIANPYDFGSAWTFSSMKFAVGCITPGTPSA